MSKIKETEAKVEDGGRYGKLFAIREVDEIGAATGTYPVISFGMTKAKAIVKHIDELKKYVEENGK